jgi:elongation factor P--(R)-beta-lysine ligase
MNYEDAKLRLETWNRVLERIHAFFRSRGFLEAHTPLLVASPGMEPNLDPLAVAIHPINDARKEVRAGLITSPEYSMKKMLGMGFGALYTITPVFRDKEMLGKRWGIEFTMLEWYRQGADYTTCMEETEALINDVLGWTEKWDRVSYVDAFEQVHGFVPAEATEEKIRAIAAGAKIAGAATDPLHEVIDGVFFATVLPVTEHGERYILCEFPVPCASLSKVSADGRYAERFEAYVGELEMCNAFTELVDADEQRYRFLIEAEERRALGKEVFPVDEDLLARLSSVASPTYGNALGVDRLVMLAMGVKDIDSTHVFPPSQRFIS